MTSPPSNEALEKRILELEAEIAHRKQIENELRESEEKFKLIFENASDEIVYISKDGTVVELNNKIEALFGYTREEVIGRKFTEFDFLKPEFLQKSVEILQHVVTGRPIKGIVEFEATHRNGQKIFFEGSSGLIRKDGEIMGVLCIVRDITGRKKIQEDLIAYQEKLRFLSNELLLTEEQERRRIARDLHDRIGQALAIAKIKLGALKEFTTSPECGKNLNEVRELIEQTILDTRTLTFELSPPILYELGFEAAIEWFSEKIQERHGIIIEVDDDKADKPMDDSIRVLMFRAARELLLNVVKHAQTKSAEIKIRRKNDTIIFVLKDDGIGFDTSRINHHIRESGGFGLFSIRDRLSHIGGHLEIESGHGKGTQVTMIVPLGLKKRGGGAKNEGSNTPCRRSQDCARRP